MGRKSKNKMVSDEDREKIGKEVMNEIGGKYIIKWKRKGSVEREVTKGSGK
jgi:hypothetical protein